MTRKHGILFAALLMLALFTGCSQTAASEAPGPDLYSAARDINLENAESYGICGENLIWYYKDHILVIRGEGPMNDYIDWVTSDPIDKYSSHRNYSVLPPWAFSEADEDLRDQIQWVFLEDGVTSVGSAAFCDFPQLSKVVLPDTIKSIGGQAFENCSALTSINIPASLEWVGYRAFYDCTGLSEIHFPESTELSDSVVSDGTKVIMVPADTPVE